MASPIQGKKKDINFSHGPWVFYRRILRGRPRILHGGISRESSEVEKWCPKQQPSIQTSIKAKKLHMNLSRMVYPKQPIYDNEHSLEL